MHAAHLTRFPSILLATAALALLCAAPGRAAAAEPGAAAPAGGAPAHANADALAKALNNPIAALISVPFQLNYDTTYGEDGDRWLMNVQPVIPISLNETWNVISRSILPLTTQTGVVKNGTDITQTGVGDLVQSFFFSPKAPTASGWVWGAGPVLALPIATNDMLGTGKWSAGPTAVALRQTASGWTYGMLANQLWSFAGDADRPQVSVALVQPFISKSLGRGRSVGANFESTYGWRGGQWTVPMNVFASQVMPIGGQMFSFLLGARAYLESPQGGADWGLRFQVTLLFPR